MNAAKVSSSLTRSARSGLGHGRRAGFVGIAAFLLAVGVGAPASAAGGGVPINVAIQPRKAMSNAGIALVAGQSATIRASGHMRFGGGRIANLGPAGLPWGVACTTIAKGQARNAPWPSPGNACWSLIGRIGTGPIFEVGTAKTIHASRAGTLFLGVNDNFVADNSGQWTARVSVSGGPTSATSPTGPATLVTPKKKSSSSVLLIVGAVVVLLLLGLLFVAARRKRKPSEVEEPVAVAPTPPPPAPVAAPASMFDAPVLAPVAAPVAVAERAPDAPPEADSIDVNIFEVEISNGLTLRVGYNHFPEGTTLRWKITQSRVPVATGTFQTQGGGSTNHVETVPIGQKLEGRAVHPDGADVQFDWAINGVPFRYSVRRDPNC